MLHVEKNAEPLRQLRAKEGVFFVTGNVNSRFLAFALLCVRDRGEIASLERLRFSLTGWHRFSSLRCCRFLTARVSHWRGRRVDRLVQTRRHPHCESVPPDLHFLGTLL